MILMHLDLIILLTYFILLNAVVNYILLWRNSSMLDSNLFENQIYLCLAMYFVTKNLAKSSLILIFFLFHSLSMWRALTDYNLIFIFIFIFIFIAY